MPLSHLGSSRWSPKGLRKEPRTLSAQPKGNLWGSSLVFGSRELRFETRACAKLGNPGLGMLKAGTVQGLPDRCRGYASLRPDWTAKRYTGTLGSGPLLMRPASYFLAHRHHDVRVPTNKGFVSDANLVHPAPEEQLSVLTGPGGRAGSGGGGEENQGCSRQMCSLEVYFPEALDLPDHAPTPRLRLPAAHQAAPPSPWLWAVSELSGDDGEGQHWAAGLQLEGGEKAVDSSLALALGFQHLAQALPRLVARALPLHGVP